MKTSAISAIIPTYNRASLISRAINSVLVQLEPEDELIVVDDGSNDDTAEMVSRYGPKVKYIRTINQGAGAARNRGIREATRPLIAFLDSDDEWLPEHLHLLRQVMRSRPDLLFCFTNFATRFSNGSIRHFALETQVERELNWGEIIGPGQPISSFMAIPPGSQDCMCFEGENLYYSQCNTSYVSVDTMIVRRCEAGDSLRFAEDTKTAEEWECGARLARAGKSAYLHCETSLVHSHTGQQLTDLDMFELASSRITIMQRVWGTDEQFLKDHREFYEQRLWEERFLRLGGLLLRGRTSEAREEMGGMENIPLAYSLLARLPGWLTKGLLDARRSIRRPFLRQS